jgi:hypothetical protein
MIASYSAYIAFVIWEFYDKFWDDPYLVEPDWKYEWVKEGFEDMLFFVILVAIMVLWRPNLNNARYLDVAMLFAL